MNLKKALVRLYVSALNYRYGKDLSGEIHSLLTIM